MEMVALCGAVLLLALPGVAAVARLFPDRPSSEHWIRGTVVGLAGAVWLAYVLAQFDLAWFGPVWGGLLLASVMFGWRGLRPHTPTRDVVTLLGVLAIVGFVRFSLTVTHEVPPGWDPTFHCVLAKKVLLAGGMIHDWTPFREFDLNYPVGSHVLIAALSGATDLPVHRVFLLLMPILAVISVAQVFAVARTWTERPGAAAIAALAYGLWALMGGLHYFRWGMLPNLLGMMFLIEGLVLVAENSDKRHAALLGLLFAGIFLTHHHVAATAAVVFAVMLLLMRTGPMLAGLAVALAIAGWALLPFLEGGVGRSFSHKEPEFTFETIRAALGEPFFWMSLLGLVMVPYRRMVGRVPLLAAIATLLLLFVGFGYGYRAWYEATYGESRTAMVPSRFLTDAVPLLAICAGYAIDRAREAIRLPQSITITLCVAAGYLNINEYQRLVEPAVRSAEWRAYEYIATATPEDTIVLNDGDWAPYATWRRCLSVPMPRSEPFGTPTPTGTLLEALNRGEVPAGSEDLTVVALTTAGGRFADHPEIWRDDTADLAVVRVR